MGSHEQVEALYGPGKQCLAPMVRAGTLPLRLLSLHYGADTVYGEEIIDYKMKNVHAVDNPELGTVDFVIKPKVDNPKVQPTLVYQTCDLEKGKNVFQIGTADAQRALHAAQLVEKHVAGVDVNMGCPKHFSISGGMGAALLKNPEKAEDILKTLRRNLNIPVTCKIRLLDERADTIELVKRLEHAGAQAIGVHMRYKHERPRERAHWDELHHVVDAVNVPVIANGDLYSQKDAKTVLGESKCSALMFARGALFNPSVFSPDGLRPVDQVVEDYLRTAAMTSNHYANTKYVVLRMIAGESKRLYEAPVSAAKTHDKMYSVFDLGHVWENRLSFQPASQSSLNGILTFKRDESSSQTSIEPEPKRTKLDRVQEQQ